MSEISPSGGARFTCRGITALVTGASRGLGREIAFALAEAGASLFLVARRDLDSVRRDVEARLQGDARTAWCAADLRDEAAVETIGQSLARSSMVPDVLVNNAATQGPIGPFWENDWQEWMDSFRLNALAPLRLCRALVPTMMSHGWGKIIFISGVGAAGPRPRFSAYGAAKTLLVRFTETLAAELDGSGVDVNAVAPGAMASAMTDAVIAAGPERAGRKEHDSALKLRQGAPGAVARAAALCVFLSSHASDGIRGRLISAAWDPWEELADRRQELSRTDVYTLRRIVPADRGLDWGSR